MTAYQPEQWHSLFEAIAGPAATLAVCGLIASVTYAWILLVEILR